MVRSGDKVGRRGFKDFRKGILFFIVISENLYLTSHVKTNFLIVIQTFISSKKDI